jgi:type II secretory pathway component GspD/PulD (secretin)
MVAGEEAEPFFHQSRRIKGLPQFVPWTRFDLMRQLLPVAVLMVACVVAVRAEDTKDDTPAATKMRQILKMKISVDIKDARLEDALNEIKDEAKGFKFMLDTKGGVSRNQKVTVKAKDKTVEEVLDELFKGPELGYYVIAKKADAYDGLVFVRKSKERGFPKK